MKANDSRNENIRLFFSSYVATIIFFAIKVSLFLLHFLGPSRLRSLIYGSAKIMPHKLSCLPGITFFWPQVKEVRGKIGAAKKNVSYTHAVSAIRKRFCLLFWRRRFYQSLRTKGKKKVRAVGQKYLVHG